MLEFVAFACALALCIWTPIETKKVRAGWVQPELKGTAVEFQARHLKKLKMFTWLGFCLGVTYGAIGAVAAEDKAKMIVKLAIAMAWIGVGVVNLIEWRRLLKPAQGA